MNFQVAEENLNHGAAFLTQSQYDSAYLYLHTARSFFEENKNHLQAARANRLLGKTNGFKGDLKASIFHFHQAISLANTNLQDSFFLVERCRAYSSLGIAYQIKGKIDSSIYFQKKAVQKYTAKKTEEDMILAELTSNLSEAYIQEGNYEKALNALKKTQRIRRQKMGEDHRTIIQGYLRLGSLYNVLGNSKLEIKTIEKALVLAKAKYGEKNELTSSAYYFLGVGYANSQQFKKAIDYYEKALRLHQEMAGPKHFRTAIAMTSIAKVYFNAGDLKKSEQYCRDAIEIYQELFNEDYIHLVTNYNLLGAILLKKEKADQAIKALQEAGRISQKQYQGGGHTSLAETEMNMGTCYAQKGDYPKAEKHFQQSLAYCKKNSLVPNETWIPSLLGFAKYHQQQKHFQEAAYYYQQILYAALPQFSKKDLFSSPDWEKHHFSLKAVSAFIQKNKCLYPKASPSDQHLIVQQNKKLLNHLYQNISKTYASAEQEQLTEQINICSNYTIELAYELSQHTADAKTWEDLFFIVERSKSNILTAMVRESLAKQTLGIPEKLLVEEAELQSLINFWEKKIYEANQKQNPVLDEWKDHLFQLNNDFEAIKKILEQNHPKYFDLKYDYSLASLKEIQNSFLKQQQAIIEYHLSDSLLFIFTITKKKLHLDRQKIDQQFHQYIQQYLKNTSDYSFFTTYPQKSYEQYSQSAFYLYQKLFPPACQQLIRSKEQLFLIPSGSLTQLSFDALLRKPIVKKVERNYKKLAYLLFDFQLGYAYSSTLLLHKKKFTKTSFPYLGFAPTYTPQTDRPTSIKNLRESPKALKSLKATSKEIDLVGKLFKGLRYKGSEASEFQFKEKAPQAQIIHLAMHATLDDKNPKYSKLHFSQEKQDQEDGYLNIYELYNLSLQADLSILSACETGAGKMVKGEGLMSMARAFRYAGCPSILTSLWKADDKSAAQLVTTFSQKYIEGADKTSALNEAKKRFLEDADKFTAHPFFWSNFVLIGNPSPISGYAKPPWVWIIGSIGFLIFLIYRIR